MIIHAKNREKFVIVSKIPLDDTRLSWKAKGLHAYLMTKPDSWVVIVAHLVRQGPDGKAAVMAALRELEDAGYVERKPRDKVRGRYDGLDCTVYEEPRKSPDDTASDFQTPHRVRFSDAENQPLVNTDVEKTDLVNIEGESSVSEPVDVHAKAEEIRRTLRGQS